MHALEDILFTTSVHLRMPFGIGKRNYTRTMRTSQRVLGDLKASMDRELLNYNQTLNVITEILHETVKSLYSEQNGMQIYRAFNFAKSIHEMQYRSTDIPFILHPLRVALMLAHFDRNITSKVFIAALLHDVLEVTDLAKSEIEKNFGDYVAELVQAVTMPRQETVATHEAKQQIWIRIIGDDHEVRAIKTFENLDNMLCWRTMAANDPGRKKIPHWLVEIREMSLPLARATNLQAYEIMQQEYMSYVTQDYCAQSLNI